MSDLRVPGRLGDPVPITADTDPPADPGAFLAGGGEVGGIMRAHDRSSSALGRPENWPQSLRSIVGLMLGAKFPMFVAWGPELGFLYNDAYAELLGTKHPAALGARFDEVWTEIWPDISPLIDAALAGRATFREDMPLMVNRRGHDERAWFTFSYSPAHDETGAIAGMFCAVQETTDRIQAERRIAAEGHRFAELFEQSPGFMIVMTGPDHVVDFVNDAHRRIFGSADWVGKSLRDAFPAIVDRGSVDLLDRVYHRGERVIADAAPARNRPANDDRPEERFLNYVCEPIRDSFGDITGVLCQGFDVTDTHSAQAALRASEAFSRRVLESSGDCIEVLGLDGGVERTGGCDQRAPGNEDRDAVIGADWARGFEPEGRAAAHAAVAEARAGRTTRFEAALTTRAGERRWWDSLVSPIAGPDGRPEKLLALSRDITDRRLVEERERFLLHLSDLTRGQTDPAALTAAATEAIGRRLGATRAGYAEVDDERTVIRAARDWTATPDLSSFAGRARPLDRLGPTLLGLLNAGRTVAVADITAIPGADPAIVAGWSAVGVRAVIIVPLVRAGRLRAILFVHSDKPRAWTPPEIELAEAVAGRTWDAMERAKAEAALREQTRTLETLNTVGAALAAELDLERLVEMVTDAGVELTGARFGAYFHNVMDESGERLHLYTLSGADRADFETMGRPRATAVFGPTFRNEGVIRADDILTDPRYGLSEPHRGMPEGHLPVRSYLGVPVVSRSGAVLGGLIFGHPDPGRFTDRHERLITGVAAQAAVAIDNARLFQAEQQLNETLEQRVRERTLELEEAHEALRQSQKMEAVGQLTGGIAHDFNNMLAVVIGSLDLLGRRVCGDDPRAKRYLDAAADGAQRAALLTQRLLAFSRRQPLRPEPVDVGQLVTGMSDLLRHSLGHAIQLDTELSADLWRTHADPNQLENAILNLSVNARDAMPGGGRLSIRTHNTDRDERDRPGEFVLICVIDTGVGMPEAVVAKAFDPFFTTKEVGKGTGLGLSQVYGFVKQTGGHIGIRSTPGEGTTVEIHLPRYLGATATDERAAGGHDLALGRREEVVLVVEDEPTVRQFSTDALGELGYRVLEADGAAAALRLLDAHPEIALLFTDVVMPEVNGAKLAEEARRRRPDLRVLFTTGYTRDAVVHDGVLDPDVQLLGKPYTVEDLAAKVRDVLDA